MLSESFVTEVAPADCWNWGKWGLKEYKWKGSFLGWFAGLFMPVQEIYILPRLPYQAQYQRIFVLTVHYFNSFVPIAQQAGQAVVQGRLSLSVCICRGR